MMITVDAVTTPLTVPIPKLNSAHSLSNIASRVYTRDISKFF
ncbi:hypothetical protein XBFFL1_1460001 [Xenorhabdus bovienii str. feltiae Florida]|nr:hypothetical protein XBFFL1_1460001 [Xenorhabdus bovienii str. feltiae Florida]